MSLPSMSAQPTFAPASMPSAGPMSLARRSQEALDRLGDHDAVFFEGTWHRSGELAARANRIAGGFAALGVRPGERVLVCMANCPEVSLTYQALWRAGAVPTPVLFLLTEDELRHVATDSGVVAAVTTPEFVAKVGAVMGGRPVLVVGDDSFSELEAAEELALVDRQPDDLAALLYTGGTTGRSKGVALTHAGLDAAGAAAQLVTATPGRNRHLLPLPLAHVYGLMVTVSGLHAREPSRSVLMRWFDPAGFLRLAAEHGIQMTSVVPSMLQMLLAQPLEDYDLSSLERVSSGGAPLAPEVALEFERRVPSAMVKEGYGCTESSALISAQPVDERRLGSVGKPIPSVDIRIEGPDGGPVPAGEDGEICVRGPVVMAGYWRAPEATAETLRGGWLHTGDVGRLDEDGWLYVVDRIKDLIIRSGFNVYPRDVEDALLTHPEIVGAACIGRPDPVLGEEVTAFVVLAPDSALTPGQIVDFAKQHLGGHKYPREITVVDAIPLTSVGKTDRKALRRRG